MKFYYKTKDGHTGSTESVDTLPSNIDKLIVRRYDGRDLRLDCIDTLNHLIFDCNKRSIENISFTTHNLSIYRPRLLVLRINGSRHNGGRNIGLFNTLVRLKLDGVHCKHSMFRNTLCVNIIPELDFTDMSWCANTFKNTNIYNIPHNIKTPTTMKYIDFYKGSMIPRHKLLAMDRLVAISKKGEIS